MLDSIIFPTRNIALVFRFLTSFGSFFFFFQISVVTLSRFLHFTGLKTETTFSSHEQIYRAISFFPLAAELYQKKDDSSTIK